MQFFVILCVMVHLYSQQRKYFYFAMGGVAAICVIIQLVIILTNDLQASYLTYQDEYWSLYYYKPYTRI